MHELDYTVLLNTVSKYFEIRRLRDYAKPADGKICLLRHDVDHDIDQAVKMAEAECVAETQSTYFVLHTEEYYKEPGFLEKCRYLQDIGHEVGLHNNIVTACVADPYLTPRSVLNRELLFLRDNGIDVVGTASHGDGLCHELNYVNYQIFKGCEVKNKLGEVNSVKFYGIDMEAEGLYEAYHIPMDAYISDSGCNWTKSHPQKKELQVPLEELEKIDDILESVRAIGNLDGNFVLQLLAHPCWWNL